MDDMSCGSTITRLALGGVLLALGVFIGVVIRPYFPSVLCFTSFGLAIFGAMLMGSVIKR